MKFLPLIAIAILLAGCGSTRTVTVTTTAAAVHAATAVDNSPSADLTGTPEHRLNRFLAHEGVNPAVVTGFGLTGGHIAVVEGREKLTGVTAQFRTRLGPHQTAKARQLCQVAIKGLGQLALDQVTDVEVWAADGSLLVDFPGSDRIC